MGQTVRFSREQALKAGIEITVVTNGTPEEIHQAELELAELDVDAGIPSQSHLEWLKSNSELIQVPGMESRAFNDHHDWTPPEGQEVTIAVTANKWGSVYEPLTEWLKANGIKWDEF